MSNMDFSEVMGMAPNAMPPPAAPLEDNSPALLEMDSPRAILEPYRNKALTLLNEAKAITVQDQGGQVAATTLAGNIKKIAKAVEEARKSYTAPINQHITSVNGLAKEVSAPLDDALRHLTGQLNQYSAKVELERRKAEEEARRQAQAEQKRLDAEAKAAGVEAPLVPEVIPAKEEPTTIRTEAGTSYQRKTWTFEVEALDKVSREYLVLNESMVRAAIKNGVRTIPGLKIFETSSTVIR
jgi:hypothetical protein